MEFTATTLPLLASIVICEVTNAGSKDSTGSGQISAQPHTVLHYSCGSICVVLCFATKKQQKQRIVPQLLHCFCHYFPLTITCMYNEVWGCAEI